MDFLTNSLTGLALSRSGLTKAVPHGTLLLFLSINAPDIDNVSRIAGPLARLEQHCGHTHSLLAWPLVAAVCVLVTALLFREGGGYFRAWLLACVGVACHLALDGITSWGFRPLLPFSSGWFHLDFSGQFDPYVWGMLGSAAIWPHFSKLVSGEIGGRSSRGRGSAIFGLIVFVLFEAARAFMHRQVMGEIGARLFDGSVPVQAAAMPDAKNPLKWTGIVETENMFYQLPMSVLQAFDSEGGQKFFKVSETAAIKTAEATEEFRYFRYFARFPVWTVEPVLLAAGEGKRVQLTDLRFGTPSGDSLGSFALEDGADRLLKSWFTFHSTDAAPR